VIEPLIIVTVFALGFAVGIVVMGAWMIRDLRAIKRGLFHDLQRRERSQKNGAFRVVSSHDSSA
jgi:hypothetical protein